MMNARGESSPTENSVEFRRRDKHHDPRKNPGPQFSEKCCSDKMISEMSRATVGSKEIDPN